MMFQENAKSGDRVTESISVGTYTALQAQLHTLKKLNFRSAIKILCMYHKVDINRPLQKCESSNWRTERNSNFGLQSYSWKYVKANDVTFTVRSFKIHITNALLICSTFSSSYKWVWKLGLIRSTLSVSNITFGRDDAFSTKRSCLFWK